MDWAGPGGMRRVSMFQRRPLPLWVERTAWQTDQVAAEVPSGLSW